MLICATSPKPPVSGRSLATLLVISIEVKPNRWKSIPDAQCPLVCSSRAGDERDQACLSKKATGHIRLRVLEPMGDEINGCRRRRHGWKEQVHDGALPKNAAQIMSRLVRQSARNSRARIGNCGNGKLKVRASGVLVPPSAAAAGGVIVRPSERLCGRRQIPFRAALACSRYLEALVAPIGASVDCRARPGPPSRWSHQ